MTAKPVGSSSIFSAKLFHFLAFLIGAFSASAQTGAGVINFGNLAAGTPDDRRIWTYGANGLVRVTGTGYRIALYWGQQGTPEAGLAQVGPAPACSVAAIALSRRSRRTVEW